MQSTDVVHGAAVNRRPPLVVVGDAAEHLVVGFHVYLVVSSDWNNCITGRRQLSAENSARRRGTDTDCRIVEFLHQKTTVLLIKRIYTQPATSHYERPACGALRCIIFGVSLLPVWPGGLGHLRKSTLVRFMGQIIIPTGPANVRSN